MGGSEMLLGGVGGGGGLDTDRRPVDIIPHKAKMSIRKEIKCKIIQK